MDADLPAAKEYEISLGRIPHRRVGPNCRCHPFHLGSCIIEFGATTRRALLSYRLIGTDLPSRPAVETSFM